MLRPHEMEWFRRCRRAWDLGSRIRQDYVPIAPAHTFNFDKAIHEALAVYYFPAMDDWDRAIVRPLAVRGFHRAMLADRKLYEETSVLTPEQEQEWREYSQLGETILNNYFQWAAQVDEFDSIFADQDLWSGIPDPRGHDQDLATADGRPVRYFARFDQLISDAEDEFWVVDHRLTTNGWAEEEDFLLDAQTLSYVWALERSYLQLKVAGTVYNELRVDVPGGSHVRSTVVDERDKRDMRGVRRVNLRRSPSSLEAASTEGRSEIVHQESNGLFRRTYVRRSRVSIENAGLHVAMQAVDMIAPDIAAYPNPTHKNCSSCAYREPCVAMSAGADARPILAAGYRKRNEEEFEEERLRWSSTRRRTRAAYGGTVARSKERDSRC